MTRKKDRQTDTAKDHHTSAVGLVVTDADSHDSSKLLLFTNAGVGGDRKARFSLANLASCGVEWRHRDIIWYIST